MLNNLTPDPIFISPIGAHRLCGSRSSGWSLTLPLAPHREMKERQRVHLEGRTYDLLRKSVLGTLHTLSENTIWRYIISAQSQFRGHPAGVLSRRRPTVALFVSRMSEMGLCMTSLAKEAWSIPRSCFRKELPPIGLLIVRSCGTRRSLPKIAKMPVSLANSRLRFRTNYRRKGGWKRRELLLRIWRTGMARRWISRSMRRMSRAMSGTIMRM